MIRFTCVVLLAAVATVSCIPIESETSKAGLVRPSPINPDVVSEPLPDEASTTTTTQATSTRETHIQKIPARGTKLSATLDQDKTGTSTSAPKEKRETETAATTPAKSNFRRDQPTTSTASHKQVSTTTAEPVSLKTPIVHPSGLKVRRSADEGSSTSKPTTTTRGPLPTSGSSSNSNSNNDDDNSGPHFVRPVPVDQILKNLHEAAPQHHGAGHHADAAAKAVEATTPVSTEGTTVNDHKFHRKTKASTTTTEAPEEEPSESHDEDDKDKDSEESQEDGKQ